MITIPTTTQLYNSIIADLQTQYGGSIPTFGKNILRVIAAVQAAKLRLYYLAIGNLQKNIFVDTADPEAVGGTLERFGRIKLNRNPFPATAGQYLVTVTGVVGAVIPILATFKSNDDASNAGKLFQLDTEFTFAGSSGTITLRALEAGLNSKMFAGEGLTITAPVPNVDNGAIVLAETVEPRAAEDIEDYRDTVVESYQLEPQGGAASDYRIWGKDAQGVREVYPYVSSDVNFDVDLYIEATEADSTDGKGTPTAGIISDVEDVVNQDPDTTKPINERGRRPLQVRMKYIAITPKDVEIDIEGFIGLTAEIEDSIFTALKEYVDAIRPFIDGADILENKNDILDVNGIINVILTVRPGSVFGAVTLTIDSVVVTTKTFQDGDIPAIESADVTYS